MHVARVRKHQKLPWFIKDAIVSKDSLHTHYSSLYDRIIDDYEISLNPNFRHNSMYSIDFKKMDTIDWNTLHNRVRTL